MFIWTTHELKDILVEGDFRLRIEHSSNVKEAMLREGGMSDCALIPLDEGYKDFLAKLRARGVTGPVIFIAEDSRRPPDEFIYPLNALCFSLLDDDIIKAGVFINFIFRLAQLRAIPDIKLTHHLSFNKSISDSPVDEPERIRDVISYVIERELPVIISFEIDEYGRPVTVRGVCRVRLRQNNFILYQFKPNFLINGIRDSGDMKIVLSYKDMNYESVIKIIRKAEHEVEVTIPDKLFIERRRYVRIVPSLKKPVRLFMLMPCESTLSLEVYDISQRGIGFYSSRDLKIGDIYVFGIQLPEQTKIIISYGIIRFKKEKSSGIRYGAELYLHPQDEELILQYIRKRELEIIEILR
ncbi:MAG: PilZ domain-containing protein [Thermodesulfovibrionales bacterium]|nr:PilZ domain-containing protein [Thermodesulfovibrionales bacterium]